MTKHWTDAHIRRIDFYGLMLHIGYDENGDVLYASTDRDEVVRRLEAYAKTPEEPTPHAVAPRASWNKAPEWATHLAIDANGEEWWYGGEPVWNVHGEYWSAGSASCLYAHCGNRIDPENAALSCYERPTQDLSDPPRPSGDVNEPLPRINIRCDFTVGSAYGSTYLRVDHVELEDDGSYTAVVADYWPK